jgi:hypothetical protein
MAALLALAAALLGSAALVVAQQQQQQQQAFGIGVPNFPINADSESEVWSYSLAPGVAVGMVTHFWSTACGGRSIDWATESGIAVYRFYIDGEANASVVFQPRMAVGLGFDPNGLQSSPAGNTSLVEPWGMDLVGKLSDMDGFYVKFRIPFYQSLRVTIQLPEGVAGFNIYTIFRGMQALPNSTGPYPFLTVPGYGPVPLGTRLKVVATNGVTVPNLSFIPFVNLTSGSGLIHAIMVSILGHPQFFYLEGCYHLMTPVPGYNATTGLSLGFPGVVLSTGTEDFYSSSFYFHAGLFASRESGVPHMCGDMAPHPRCVKQTSQSEWSAYWVASDALPFQGGVQFVARNGDKAGPTPYGSGKCYNTDMVPDGMSPGPSVVSTLAWVYLFPESE